MFFTRSVLSSAWKWMKLPAGSSLPGGADAPKGPSVLPKCSRVLTAAILAAAVLVLALPEGREAIRTVRASWQEYQPSDSDARTLEKLAARAGKENDAGTLAFVALSAGDPKRAAALTERAVALHPNLIWVYGSRNHRPDYDPPQKEWLARLQAADSDNAVPYLLAADALDPSQFPSLYQHGVPKDVDFEAVESHSNWMALMERAYGAPRYDSYFQRHFDLTRTVWSREKNLSPVLVLSGLWSHAIPDLMKLRAFADVKIHEAQKARAAGDLKQAESVLDEVNGFGMRMADGSGTYIERLIGWRISQSADKELVVFYSSSGRSEDEQKVRLRIEQIDASFRALRPGHDSADRARAQVFRREGMLVQGFGTLALIASLAALAGVLMLEMWPSRIRKTETIWRRVPCWLADYSPTTLLVASVAFLASFLPFQRAFEEYRTSKLPYDQRLTDSLWGLLEIPQYVMNGNASVSIWTFVTVALSILLLFVLLRGFYRARRTVAKPA